MLRNTDTLVVGGGQAGLSLSRRLAVAGHRHVVLERGRVGERWRSERWDSLTLLTPNWLNRLDGAPAHADADGFLGRAAFVEYLGRYASRAGRVHEHVTVRAVEPAAGGFRVDTDAGGWRARNVVIATGDSALPRIPALAASVPRGLLQLHASRYRYPEALPPGGVLVVGAGPSGHQIAAELRRAGRHVVLAVGRHARMVRRYRGADIWHWLKELGDVDRAIDEVPDLAAARAAPAFALTGANGGEQLDLATLRGLGVEIAGRLERFEGGRAVLANDLAASTADADLRLSRVLDRIDEHLGSEHRPHATDRPAAVDLPPGQGTLDLAAGRISTVIWATGYRREYPWLHVPALDAAGEIVHSEGITPVAGLYVLGLKFQRRRSSHTIGGVGADAEFIAERLLRSPRRALAWAPASTWSQPRRRTRLQFAGRAG